MGNGNDTLSLKVLEDLIHYYNTRMPAQNILFVPWRICKKIERRMN